MLQQIRQRIKECERIIDEAYQSSVFREKINQSNLTAEEIAKEFNDKEVRTIKFKKTFASLMMQKNNAIADLEKLLIQSRNYILEKTKVYLVETDKSPEEVVETIQDKVCFVLSHKAMAYRLANVLMPAVKIGDLFSGNLMAILNDILDGVEEEIGVSSAATPRIEMRMDCMRVITSLDSLVNLIEHMLETQMYPSDAVKEGHFLQALYNRVQYLNMTHSVEDEKHLHCVIVAPKISKVLANEYARFISPNIVVVDGGLQNLSAHLPVSLFQTLNAELDESKTKRKYNKKMVA